MHILVGALIGALAGVAVALVVAKIRGTPVTWHGVLAAAVGGAVGGAITAATFGVGGAAAATATRAATAYVAGGAGTGAAGRATENLLDGRPVQEGVATSTAVGAGTGLALFGAGRAVGALAERFTESVRLPARATSATSAAKPEPEPYVYRVPPPAKPGEIVRVRVADLRTRQNAVDYGNGHYSETELFDPIARRVTTDATRGTPMVPEVSWVDWIDGVEPFWAIREGNHRAFDAVLQGREEIAARVVTLSRETAERSLWADRPYVPFMESQVWKSSGGDEVYAGNVGSYFGEKAAPPPPHGEGVTAALAKIGER